MHHLCNRLSFMHGLCTVYARTLLLVYACILKVVSMYLIAYGSLPKNPLVLMFIDFLFYVGHL
jgi:hypothetical protein